MNLEDFFCSKTRIKILKLLFLYGQLNTSSIMAKVRVNYEITLGQLELLEEEGIVQHRNSGRAKQAPGQAFGTRTR